VPTIEVDDELYKRLLGLVQSFEDTASSVIQRLLDQAESPFPANKLISENVSSPKEGDLLPEGEYWLPILGILDEEGGEARGSDVIDALEAEIGPLLRQRDHDVLRMGEVRWRNRARFARLRMKELGLISNESPRGIWEITSKGRRFLEEEGG
jgi:restriction system protein